MSGPMDPGDLDELREIAADGRSCLNIVRGYVVSLLEAHDHHVKRGDDEAKRADKAEADARSWKAQADEEFRGQVAAWNEVGR